MEVIGRYKYVFIDHREFLEQIPDIAADSFFFNVLKKKMRTERETADFLIKLKLINNSMVLFINANLDLYSENVSPQSLESEYSGIKLLMWFRLMGVKNPIVIYSFESLNNIIKNNPQYFILCAPGSYFHELPEPFDSLPYNELEQVKDLSSLKIFLRPAFSITNFRHTYANWWGVKQLYDIYHTIFYPTQSVKYPPHITKQHGDLNNRIGEFLHKTSQGEISKVALSYWIQLKEGDIYFDSSSSRAKKIESNQTKKLCYYYRIKDLVKYLRKSENIPKILFIDDQYDQGWADILVEIFYGHSIYNNHADEFQDGIVINKPKPYFKQDSLQVGSREVKYRKFDLSNNVHPYFLGIDGKMFWEAIYDENKKKISRDLLIEFLNKIGAFEIKRFDVLLLDLRLIGNEVAKKQQTGLKVLSQIGKILPGFPVILFTASNKSYTSQEALNIGAMGHWVKEGIDENRPTDKSIFGLVNLLQLIFNAKKESRFFLREVLPRILNIKTSKKLFWWEKYRWGDRELNEPLNKLYVNNDLNSPNKKRIKISQILEETISDFTSRILLKEYGLKNITKNYWVHYSSLTSNLGKIIEIIHRPEQISDLPFSFRNLLENTRNDMAALDIYMCRNVASHAFKIKNKRTRVKESTIYDFSVFKEVLSRALCYLEDNAYWNNRYTEQQTLGNEQ